MSQPLADTAIEITADTEPFEKDVDRLAKQERRRKIVKPVEADTTEMLRQIERALDGLRGEVELDADTRRMIVELDRALDGFEGDVNLDPNVTKLAADVEAALAGLEFEAPIKPKLLPLRDAKGRFVKAGAELGNDAATGFDRAFGDRMQKSAGEISGAIGGALGPASGIFLKAAVGAVAFAGALQTISGLVAALGPAIVAGLAFLPGFLLARAVALGVFKLAVIGVGEALAAAAEGDAAAFEAALEKLSPAAREFAVAAREAIDALRPLQQLIQETTFAGLADDVTRAGAALQGTRDDAASVALGFNRIAAEVLAFVGSEQAIDGINRALAGVRDFLFEIRPAIQPLLTAFTGLAAQAGQFGGSIGATIARIASKFASFLNGIDLAALFENALPVLRDLGAILSNVGQIASTVFAAAGSEGTGLIGIIAQLTGTVDKFLGTAEGFETLQTLMGAASQIATALGGAIGALLPPLAAAITPIAAALGPVADAIGQVLAAVAPLLPPLGQLIAILGGALVQAIIPLVPVIASLATLIGGALTAMAPVLAQVGNTIGQILGPAAQLLVTIFDQLAPVIADVGAQLAATIGPILAKVGPLFTQLVEAVLPLVPTLISLIPPLLEIAVALTPLIMLAAELTTALVAVLAPVIKLAAQLLKLAVVNVIAPQIRLFADALTYVLQPVQAAITKVSEFAAFLNSVDWGAVGAAIGNAFQTAWQTVVTAVEGIVGFVTALPGRIMSVLASIPGLVAGLFRRMGDLALQAIGVGIGLIIANVVVVPQKILSALAALPGLVRNLFTRALTAARTAAVTGFNNLVAFVASVPGKVSTALSRLGSIISTAWTRAVAAGRTAAVNGFNNIVEFVRGIPGKISALAGRFVSAGGSLVRALVNGLKNVPSLGSIGSAIASVIRSQANNIIAAINAGISRVDSFIPGSLPRIPSFARGAVVDKATLGIFGEAGREVIIPLERPQRARQLAEESGLDRILTSGADGAPVYVSLRAYIGDTEITRMITFEVDRALDETAAQVDAGVRTF